MKAKTQKSISLFDLSLIAFLFLFTTPSITYAQWIQKGSEFSGEAAGDLFGCSVSMPTAYTVAISGIQNDGNGVDAGHTRVFQWTGYRWFQKGSDIDGETSGDLSGAWICMPDINTIAIGASRNNGNGNNSGHVRIFRWTGSAWVQKGNDINGETAGDFSGASITMPDANTIAIGAPSNSGKGNYSGHVRVYYWSGNTWLQKGNDIDGEAANDRSGISVSMPNSNTVAVGALYNSNKNRFQAGHVRIYRWSGNAWVQKGNDIDGEANGDFSGASISMPDTSTIAIGAPFNNNTGHVRIYQWSGSSWSQKGNDIDGTNSLDEFGNSVSMPDANTVAIGSKFSDVTGMNAGKATIYHWSGNTWTQIGSTINGIAADDKFGYSVSMPDNNTVAIGAILNDNAGNDAGHVRIYSFNSIGTNLESNHLLKEEISIYPNPTKSYFYFKLHELVKDNNLSIFNSQGKQVYQQTINKYEEKINIKNLNAGVYFVRYNETIKKMVVLE